MTRPTPRTTNHQPTEYRPQLATLVKAPPSGNEWLHEIKFDGYRIGCRIRRGRVTLISRNGKDWTAAFPEIADAAARLAVRDVLLDGEVAMALPDGRTSFQALQNAFTGAASRAGLVYFVFDVLRHEGRTRPLSRWPRCRDGSTAWRPTRGKGTRRRGSASRARAPGQFQHVVSGFRACSFSGP